MAPQTLRVADAFGPTLQAGFLLAGHPKETQGQGGKPVPGARTFLLQIQGDRAVVRDEIPLRLWRSAYSRSGAAYCAGFATNTIRKYIHGVWLEEQFTDQPEDVIRSVHVSPGETADDDTVFLGSNEHLFIRQANKWQKHALAEGFPLQMVGELPEVSSAGPSSAATMARLLVSSKPRRATRPSVWR